jgi:hypothetical protein
MTETWSGFIFADPVAAATPNAVATISPSTADATESFMIPPSVLCASSQVEAPPSGRCSYLASPSVMAITDWSNRSRLASEKAPHLSAMLLRPEYLSQKLDRPLPTKDGGTLRTVAEARTYMLGLSKDRELRAQWQHAAELLLAEADVADFSKQIELALFYDGKLVLTA